MARTAHINAEGRITIPADLRKTHGIEPDSDLELISNDTGIYLKPAIKKCIFCDSPEPTETLFKIPVCSPCIEKIKFIL
jgi:AbrB family looped-hinge helix DNA binding protein